MVVLFVMMTVIVALTIDWMVQRRQLARAFAAVALAPPRVVVPASFTLALPGLDALAPPEGLFWAADGRWLQLEAAGTVLFGVDHLIPALLGGVERIDSLPVRAKVDSNTALLSLVRGTRTLAFASPVSGEVCTLNHELLRRPELLSADPYRQGWICRLKLDHLGASLRELLVGPEGQQAFSARLAALRNLLVAGGTPSAGYATAADGGVVAPRFGAELDDARWLQLAKAWLGTEAVAATVSETHGADGAKPLS